MNDDIKKRLRGIEIEDFVWGVYLIIIGLSFYANYLERDSIINRNRKSSKEYKDIETFVFILSLLIYIYLFIRNYDNLVNCKSKKKIKAKQLLFYGAFLALISGSLFLYVSVKYRDDNEEIVV